MEQSTSVPMEATTTQGQKLRKPLLSEPQVTAILFLLPALLIFVVFVVWPIISSAKYSFYAWGDGARPLAEAPYVGLQNYQKLLDDPIFGRALRDNILVVVWSLVTQIPLGIGLAILLTGKLKGSSLFRTLYFAPLVLSDVLIGVIFQWFFNPVYGMANAFLKAIHVPNASLPGWLGDPNLSLWCILFVATWRYLGFYIVIFIAAIQSIPPELYEAAQIDGANSWRMHRYITIPLLSTATRTSAVLIIVGSLKFFDLVWVLTEGGPSNSSQMLATYMFFQAFRKNDLSYGSAIAFALFIIAFLMAILFLSVTSRRSQTA
jgi:raffinose/stachyose/melibiose transport system permease protein